MTDKENIARALDNAGVHYMTFSDGNIEVPYLGHINYSLLFEFDPDGKMINMEVFNAG